MLESGYSTLLKQQETEKTRSLKQIKSLLTKVVKDEGLFFRFANGYSAYPWQVEVLNDSNREITIRASRQAGKTQVVATKVLYHAITHRSSLILITSPTVEKSSILFNKLQIFINIKSSK